MSKQSGQLPLQRDEDKHLVLSENNRSPHPGDEMELTWLDRQVLELSRRFGVQITLAVATIFVLLGMVGCAWFGYRVYRIEYARQAIRQINASYAWNHESGNSYANRSLKLHRKLANILGPTCVSDISVVQIDEGDPDDQQLQFLNRLTNAQSISLRSNRASDATLANLRNLKSLRELAVTGQQFTVFGLLQLREVSSLEKLSLEFDNFSAIELAVLRAELADVAISDISSNAATAILAKDSYEDSEESRPKSRA